MLPSHLLQCDAFSRILWNEILAITQLLKKDSPLVNISHFPVPFGALLKEELKSSTKSVIT